MHSSFPLLKMLMWFCVLVTGQPSRNIYGWTTASSAIGIGISSVTFSSFHFLHLCTPSPTLVDIHSLLTMRFSTSLLLLTASATVSGSPFRLTSRAVNYSKFEDGGILLPAEGIKPTSPERVIGHVRRTADVEYLGSYPVSSWASESSSHPTTLAVSYTSPTPSTLAVSPPGKKRVPIAAIAGSVSTSAILMVGVVALLVRRRRHRGASGQPGNARGVNTRPDPLILYEKNIEPRASAPSPTLPSESISTRPTPTEIALVAVAEEMRLLRGQVERLEHDRQGPGPQTVEDHPPQYGSV
ncbi:hypothetical protein DFH09DRAFT_1070430 [Mycena vulgaris]|nr:hypothetical protein DFH09DRAFT_1070430 [Mycena vulgaris]